MTALATYAPSLPGLIDRAAKSLSSARSAAEVLDARDMASVAYDAAKRAARFVAAKGAHDDLIAAAHRAQGNALEIEAQAKHRIADEYDAAQERGEVTGRGGGGERSGKEHSPASPAVTDLGLTRKDIHEARAVRDAESADPGIVHRTVEERLSAGEEPTKASLRKALKAAAKPSAPAKRKTKTKPKRKRQPYVEAESEHDRDLQMLRGVWEGTCMSAREEFLRGLGYAVSKAA